MVKQLISLFLVGIALLVGSFILFTMGGVPAHYIRLMFASLILSGFMMLILWIASKGVQND